MQAAEVAVRHHQHTVAGPRFGDDRLRECVQIRMQAQPRTVGVGYLNVLGHDLAISRPPLRRYVLCACAWALA